MFWSLPRLRISPPRGRQRPLFVEQGRSAALGVVPGKAFHAGAGVHPGHGFADEPVDLRLAVFVRLIFRLGCRLWGVFGHPRRLVVGTAHSLHIADELGSIDQVARDVIKAEELVDYSRRDNVAERLVKRFGAAMGEGAWRAMRNSTAIR